MTAARRGARGASRRRCRLRGALPAASFDDIVYFGADADRIEQLQGLLATGGVIDIVLGGDRRSGGPSRSTSAGSTTTSRAGSARPAADAADGYAMAPANGELRAGDRVAVIGAAGPMGFMHVIRTVSSALPGLSLTAIDIDEARLAHLASIAGPLAASRGIPASFVNSRTTPVDAGFSYVAVMVPAPPLVAQAVELAAAGARINVFAGFAAGTRAALDLDAVLAKGIYLFGTSGSRIPDMQAVLRKLEHGELDTNISVDAITGMEGVRDALAAVEARTSGGKIVVYPALHDLGMVRLPELAGALPHRRGRPPRRAAGPGRRKTRCWPSPRRPASA